MSRYQSPNQNELGLIKLQRFPPNILTAEVRMSSYFESPLNACFFGIPVSSHITPNHTLNKSVLIRKVIESGLSTLQESDLFRQLLILHLVGDILHFCDNVDLFVFFLSLNVFGIIVWY